jgi:hypothetical protein
MQDVALSLMFLPQLKQYIYTMLLKVCILAISVVESKVHDFDVAPQIFANYQAKQRKNHDYQGVIGKSSAKLQV